MDQYCGELKKLEGIVNIQEGGGKETAGKQKAVEQCQSR